MSWLPPISTFLGDEYEDGDVSEESSSTSLTPHQSSSSLLLSPQNGGSNDGGAEDDDDYYDEEDEDHPSRRVHHYGFFVNEINVKFKALERPTRPQHTGRPGRVKFIPFMKLHFQGVIVDMVFRGEEANHQMGAAYVRFSFIHVVMADFLTSLGLFLRRCPSKC